MSSQPRRIDPTSPLGFGQPNGGHDKLKNIAGLIRGLSYNEMKEFAGWVKQPLCSPCDLFEIADGLLQVADAILQKPEKNS